MELKAVLRRPAVWVAAMGYFVDLFDLVLFGVVRVPSLKAIGVPEADLLNAGAFLLNSQMAGMLVGGFFWGILGDRKGRFSVLFGSIFLYSVANVANAFVTDVASYSILRFLAGLGLAGELGAAVTLVAEIVPKHLRGYGSTIIGGAGFLGAISASLIGSNVTWKAAYIIGGLLGLSLLIFRLKNAESGMYSKSRAEGGESRWGDLRMLFGSWERLGLYLRCVLIGTPIWYIAGILMYFSPEFGKSFGITTPLSAGYAIMWNYVGAVIGDISAGIVSQKLKSRKKTIAIFVVGQALSILAFFYWLPGRSAEAFYFLSVMLGIAGGYWALFVVATSEQFGTNLRATATSSVPNLVRASVIPMVFAFRASSQHIGIQPGAIIVGVVSLSLSLFALMGLHETFHRDLDYLET